MNISSKKVVAGLSWVALIAYANRFLGFVTTLVLAKLLDPEHFGLVAIASMLIEVLQIFKDMGLSEALIYKKENIQEATNTAFLLLVGFNTFLFVLAFIISPFAADFYNDNMVMPVIIVMSSNLIWDGIRAIPRALLRKEIQFKKLVIPEVIPVLTASIVSLVMAFMGYGVWSLVVRTVLHSFLGMIFLLKIMPMKLSFHFNYAIAKELFQYGRFIVVASVMLVVLYNVDKFYVSKFAGIEFLGLYELAMRISDLPVKEFSYVIGSVMFPVFTKMNQDGASFKFAFLKTIKYSTMISMPLSIGIAIYGSELISIIYGAKWERMVVPLRILAFYALFRSMSSLIYDVFKASGNPQLMQRYIIFRLLMIGLLGIPALYFGQLEGLCILVLVTYFIVFFFETRALHRVISLTILEFWAAIRFNLFISIITIIVPYFILNHFIVELNLYYAISGILVTIVLFIVANFWFNQPSITEIKNVLFARKTK